MITCAVRDYILWYNVLGFQWDWHDGQHNLLPWWEYFLGTLVGVYGGLEERVGVLTTSRGAKREMVFDAV